jgi:MarR family transcriptional regulator, organic hydroperoxide resistance regulator
MPATARESNATPGSREGLRRRGPTRANAGFDLAKASQRWNELLAEAFAARGFPEVRPAYGSVLLPLFEEDRLRMGELAARSRLSKQTITTLVRRVIAAGLVHREPDPSDGRAARVELTPRALAFAPVAADVVRDLERQVNERLSDEEYRALRVGLRVVMDL